MEVNQDKYANLTTGYDNAATENGNITAESVFEQVLPNVVAAKSNELFALARKSSVDIVIWACMLRNRNDVRPYVSS